jgi:hypothetical protein
MVHSPQPKQLPGGNSTSAARRSGRPVDRCSRHRTTTSWSPEHLISGARVKEVAPSGSDLPGAPPAKAGKLLNMSRRAATVPDPG